MIVVMKPGATAAEIGAVIRKAESMGAKTHPIYGDNRTDDDRPPLRRPRAGEGRRPLGGSVSAARRLGTIGRWRTTGST